MASLGFGSTTTSGPDQRVDVYLTAPQVGICCMLYYSYIMSFSPKSISIIIVHYDSHYGLCFLALVLVYGALFLLA